MNSLKKLVRAIVPRFLLRAMEQTYRAVRGIFWQAYYGFPARGLKVIAVTGTNGKSTTASYINNVLRAGGYKTAILTTPFMEIAGKNEARTTTRTLEKQSEVQHFLARAKRAKVDWTILEVTSHALDQRRIQGVKIKIAVITNLTQEHLDYHKTMQAYARAKATLTRDYGAEWAVLNGDDEWFEFFKNQSTAEVFSFGKKSGLTAQIKDLQVSPSGSQEKFVTDGVDIPIKTSLLGEFNLYNASVAACIGFILKIDPQAIQKGIAALKAVPGRMEQIDEGQNFEVLVDYAVTPDAIANVLDVLQKIAKGRVIIVFGATGDRDREKRPLMGEAAAKNADLVFLTDDETYTEDPKTIRDAVFAGMKRADGEAKTTVVEDRLEAIKQAFATAKSGDIVLLTGIGHENQRNMGGQLQPWDERDIARNLLKDLQNN